MLRIDRTRFICLLLAAITLGVYWPVVGYQFINLDDGAYVTENPYVRSGLSLHGLAWAFKVGYGGNWDPLTWISHMLDCELYGLQAGGHHFTNLLFHAANAVLLFLVLQRLTGTTWRSAFVAALFAWHPLHVESVAWISERKDVLSTFFFLLTVGAYAAYVARSRVSSLKSPVSSLKSGDSAGGSPDKSGPRELERLETEDLRLETDGRSTLHAPRQIPSSSLWYGLALLFFTLGLMSKPMLVTLPFVLLLLDFWPLQRVPVGRGVPTAPPPAQGAHAADWGQSALPTPPNALPGGFKVQGSRFKVQGSGGGAESGQAGPRPHPSKFKIKNLKLKIFLPLLWEKLPFFALAALCCFLTVKAQAGSYAVISLEILPLCARVGNALVSYVLYLWKMIWPRDLAVLYPYSQEWGLWAAAGAGFLVVLISAAVVWQARRRGYLAAGWFWFLGTLVPVLGLVQVGLQRMGDRYTYIPLIGIFIAVAWGIPELAEHLRGGGEGTGGVAGSATYHSAAGQPRSAAFTPLQASSTAAPREYPWAWVLGAAAAAMLLALLLCTRAQLRYWQNSVALFSHAAKVAPGSLLTEYSLARALGDQGHQEQAIIHYLKVLQIRPNRIEASRNWHLYARLNLGNIYANQQRWPEAEAQYRALLGQEPGLRPTPRDPTDRTETSVRSGELAPNYGAASPTAPLAAPAASQPKSPLVSQSLGVASRVQAWRWFGVALNKQGKSAEALQAYREAVRLNPNGAVELNDLAWFLATDPHADLRDGNEAVPLALRACELTGGREPRCLGTLDAAYAEVGRFAEAIATAQMAQAMAQAQGQSDVAAAAAERLALYRAGKAYRQSVNQ